MDWNHLRTFVAVVDAGTLTAAARTLGISQPTAGRQIEALEAAIGTALFARDPRGGRQLTVAGEALLPAASNLVASGRRIEALTVGAHEARRTRVVVAAGAWTCALLMRNLDLITAGCPETTIELRPSLAPVDLVRDDVDLAIRNCTPEGAELRVRRLKAPVYATYASVAYAAANPAAFTDQRFDDCEWLMMSQDYAGFGTYRWLEAKLGSRRPKARCSSSLLLLEGVRAGQGLGLLPAFLGDAEPDLVRVSAVINTQSAGLWLVRNAAQPKRRDVDKIAANIARFYRSLPIN